MYFSTIMITLCFNYLICNRVCLTSGNSLLNNLKLSKSEIIDEFFHHFKRSYLKKYEPRHVTVIGRSDEDLARVKSLFEESYCPAIICKDTKKCLYAKDYSPGNFVFVFMRDFTYETFNRSIDIFSRCTECKLLFISERVISIGEIWRLFNLSFKRNLGYVEFIHFNKKVVKLYSHFIANNCSMEVRLMFVWKPGINLKNIDTWAFLERDLNGCPVSISTSSFEPKMIIETGKNGSVQSIVGGREGKLILALANSLNFTLALGSPSATERLKYSRKASIVNDVVSGMAKIGIGRLRPTNDIHDSIVHSVMYDDECITWGVPMIIKWSNNVVSVEFTRRVWVLIGVVFIIGCTTGYLLEKISSSKNGEQTKIGFVAIVLDVIAIHLGNPVVNLAVFAGGKFALIALLCYAMVLTTAYKTSLASLLTTEKGIPTIVDVDGIIKENLSLGGSQYDFNMLNDQVNESEINIKLVKRFVVNNNDSETLQRLKSSKDFALLARGSSLHDEKQKSVRYHDSVTFDVFDTCVLAYHTVMIIRKDSFLRRPVNLVIRRLSESGILEYWDIDKYDTDQILKRRSSEKFFKERAGDKFKTIFFLYFCCIALCILIFFIELITSRFNLKKSQNAADDVSP